MCKEAIMNLLPTAENLWNRKVLQDLFCPRCKMKAESVKHVVMDYKVAKHMWKLTSFKDNVQSIGNQDLLDMMKEKQRGAETDNCIMLDSMA